MAPFTAAFFSLGLFTVAACEAPRRGADAQAVAVEKPRPLTDQQRLHVLVARVQTGEITSEQAGCEYRFGHWDAVRKACVFGPDATATPPRP